MLSKTSFPLALLFLKICVGGFSKDLVFIHLGEDVPSHLRLSVEQARDLNRASELYLLVNQGVYQKLSSSFQDVHLINVDLLPKTKAHQDLIKTVLVDKTAPDAYLFYTLERFFYLLDFLEIYPLEDLVHLENDTMLYMSLEEMLPLFKKANIRLATPFLSKVAAVPCIVFIKDALSLSCFLEHVLEEAKGYQGPKPYVGLSDMKLLASFYRKKGSSYLMPLPTLMPEYGAHYKKRKSKFFMDNATALDFLWEYSSHFPGLLFDAASLGVYADGNDRRYKPHNKAGTVHFRSLFDPRMFSFFWDQDVEKLYFPFLAFQEKSYRIVNLHIHSKELGGFRSQCNPPRAFP